MSLVHSLESFSSEILSLLTGDLSDPCPLLRETTLRALDGLDPAHFLPHPPLGVALLVARHDSEETNRNLAER